MPVQDSPDYEAGGCGAELRSLCRRRNFSPGLLGRPAPTLIALSDHCRATWNSHHLGNKRQGKPPVAGTDTFPTVRGPSRLSIARSACTQHGDSKRAEASQRTSAAKLVTWKAHRRQLVPHLGTQAVGLAGPRQLQRRHPGLLRADADRGVVVHGVSWPGPRAGPSAAATPRRPVFAGRGMADGPAGPAGAVHSNQGFD